MNPEARQRLDEIGFGEIVAEEPLQGGLIGRVTRLVFADRRTLVLKECDQPLPCLFECEADGLASLRLDGCPRIPAVFGVGSRYLLIEDFGPQHRPPDGYWAEFGRQIARLHRHTADRFGYHRSNYQGTILMDNAWCDDGAAFFGQTRLLRFLRQPRSMATLTNADIDAVERLVAKLPDLIPPQSPCLVHGDLWPANMLVADRREPALIDPAVHFGLPEADLALLPYHKEVPSVFFDAYQEVRPLEAGWRDRTEIYALRDALAMVAEFGEEYGSVERVRRTVGRYA